MRFVRLLGAAAVVGALLSGGFAAAANASSAMPAPCWLGNHRDLHLDASDNGRTVRVCRGAKIDITLNAPSGGPMWSAVRVSGGAVTVDRHHPRVFLPRGVTAGYFVATRRGSAELTSSRPTCAANPGGPTCHSMQGWKVDISVR